MKAYYGVRKGRIPGVYDNWASCKAQVEKCANEYRGFKTYEEAAEYVATGQTVVSNKGSAKQKPKPKRTHPPPVHLVGLGLGSGDEDTQQLRGISVNNIEIKPPIKLEPLDASQSYFSQVPNFEPDNKADFDEEFGRFASSQNIAPGSKAWRQQRTDAVRHEMIFHYSQKVESDDDDDDVKKEEENNLDPLEEKERQMLKTYQNMCREAKLEPLDTIEGCVANLKSVLVNIIDYINAKRNGKPIKVWPPHEFEAFKRYTLDPDRRFHMGTAREGDGFLAALLQVLRPPNAADTYQHRRHRAAIAREDCASRVSSNIPAQKTERRLEVIKEEPSASYGQECEVISIHGSDSDFSSPPRTIDDDDIAETFPSSSNSSVTSSVIEVPSSGQTGIKRKYNLDQGSDASEDELTLTRMHKRLRV
ncbi:hypothetical protein HD806DRAFT_178480 [Xylariaceae sp. AK1471]|nr:hypothetical protein HD806DRAFT_178480 [Xylariaceae sp. AK1471]